MLKRLLVSVSAAPATAAESQMALQLAKLHGASITGFTAVNTKRLSQVGPASAGAFSYRKKLIESRISRGHEEAEKALDAMHSLCAAAGVGFRSFSQEAPADRALADAWRFHDLAIMPAHPWAPGENELGDPNSILHLVALGLRPLIIVPAQTEPIANKALVALSGSLDSAKSFKHFIQLGVLPAAAVHIVTVGEPKSGEQAEHLLDQAARYSRAYDLETTTQVLRDAEDRTQCLIDHAQEVGAGIMVIGSSYTRFLSLERFGSHATGLLTRAQLPLFISH